jgi:hypothetical protein
MLCASLRYRGLEIVMQVDNNRSNVWCSQAAGFLLATHFAEEGKRGYLVIVSL